ncbi:hypothetical protein C448_02663 [Halococcus morrhuae DSM 1307]|uniref:Uncharacterized protein n=1 Tax=Halococcus morrhuae DSM 1307 TaxID=931277 RepID=M0MSM3_HALMO|nr:hypothetical protein [Halococcus morrhuae]EMA48737.1 hypothetical protein C448_02663 [Halococcus morrhuae DSM 1307]
MVLTESEWDAAEPTRDVRARVEEILEEDGRAYCVGDFFRDAGPDSERFEPLAALVEALDWQTSKNRSELLVETALERLVADGTLEKRVRQEDDTSVAYYRTVDR